jgi:hypothetical protein
MTIELGQRASVLRLVLATAGFAACGAQPVTIGESEAAEVELVAEQRQALGTTAHYLLSDGSSSFAVKSLEGGAVKAPVISTTVGINGAVNKFLGARTIEPVTVPIGLNAAASYVDWAQAALNGQFSPKDFLLSQCDFDYKEVVSRSFEGSVLTALTFGPFDTSATSSSVPLFKTTFAPERSTTRAGNGGPCKQPPAPKSSYTGLFALELDGLDATGVTTIGELTLTRVVPECSGKEVCSGGGSLVIPSMRVGIAEGRVDSWLSWFDDFVVKGNDGAGNERSGTLTLLGLDLKKVYLKIGLGGVGIAQLTNDGSVAPGSDKRWVAELYVERVTLTKPK